MKITKLIFSAGVAVAAAKLAKSLTNVGVDDALGFVGLERRRGHGWEKLAFFGAGALAGAGAGLLLAPASGRDTRKKIGEGMDTLATKATEALAEGPELFDRVMGETSAAANKGDADAQRHNGNQGR